MMASLYRPFPIPETPSKAINHALQQRFGHAQQENIAKLALRDFVCLVFHAINTAYKALKRDVGTDSVRLWVAACAIVSGAIAFVCFVAYEVILASSFIVHAAVYYGFIAIALFAIGLGVAGAVFFDKAPHGTEESSRTHDSTLGYMTHKSYTSTTTTSTSSKVE